MPNQLPLEAELAIVDDALTHPLAGPRTIAAALRERFGVGCRAVYNALQRRGLANRAKRRAELDRRRAGQPPPDAVERERALSRQRHLKAPEPGYIACGATAVVGRLKEAGIVHMAVAIDGHSSSGTVVLAPARNAQMAAAALKGLKREREGLGIAAVGRARTDNGTEFKGRPAHPFEALCARLGIQHRTPKVRHVGTNGKAERFIQTGKDVLAITLVGVVLAAGVIPLMVVGPRLTADLAARLGLDSSVAGLWPVIYWVTVIVVGLVALTSLYHIAPGWHTPWRRDLPRAALALVGWAAAAWAIRRYTTQFLGVAAEDAFRGLATPLHPAGGAILTS